MAQHKPMAQHKKAAQVLREEVSKLPQRCPGYQEEMLSLLVDVLTCERDHSISRTRIVKKIADKVSATARTL